MSNFINNDQPNGNVYTYLAQIQSIYLQYIQIRTRLTMMDDNLKTSSVEFDRLPTQQNLYAVHNAWNQKFTLIQQIPHIVNNIVSNLTEATKFVLSSMQLNIAANNRLGATLNDNAIASICSFVEQDPHQLHIQELYKQYCITQNVPMQLSHIEIRAQMMRLLLPNFDNLKKIIRGY